MTLKILESSFNLRVENGKTNTDYELKKTVADKQLGYEHIDLYCNVEYMECQDEEYLYESGKKYKMIYALF